MCTLSATTTAAAAFCLSMTSLVLIADSAGIINDSSSDFWRNWLFIDDIDDDNSGGNLLPSNPHSRPNGSTRRITPKSVFIAPSFTKCADGYKSDGMGSCVKIIRIDEAAQWSFLFQKLNSMYAAASSTTDPPLTEQTVPDNYYEVAAITSYAEDNNSGPFQLPIPLSNIGVGRDENITLFTFSPYSTISSDLQSAAFEYTSTQNNYYNNPSEDDSKNITSTTTADSTTTIMNNITSSLDDDTNDLDNKTSSSSSIPTFGYTLQLFTETGDDMNDYSNSSNGSDLLSFDTITTDNGSTTFDETTNIISTVTLPAYQVDYNNNTDNIVGSKVNDSRRGNMRRKCNLKYHQCQRDHHHHDNNYTDHFYDHKPATSQKVHIVSAIPYFFSNDPFAYDFTTTIATTTTTTTTTNTDDSSTITDIINSSSSSYDQRSVGTTTTSKSRRRIVINDRMPTLTSSNISLQLLLSNIMSSTSSAVATDDIISTNTVTDKAFPAANNMLRISSHDNNYYRRVRFSTPQQQKTSTDYIIESST